MSRRVLIVVSAVLLGAAAPAGASTPPPPAPGTFALPPLTDWQQRIITTAFSFVGYPYVWGGTSERAEAPAGVKARGGFDCSGFVWRVYKLQRYDGEGTLADTLRGG